MLKDLCSRHKHRACAYVSWKSGADSVQSEIICYVKLRSWSCSLLPPHNSATSDECTAVQENSGKTQVSKTSQEKQEPWPAVSENRTGRPFNILVNLCCSTTEVIQLLPLNLLLLSVSISFSHFQLTLLFLGVVASLICPSERQNSVAPIWTRIRKCSWVSLVAQW